MYFEFLGMDYCSYLHIELSEMKLKLNQIYHFPILMFYTSVLLDILHKTYMALTVEASPSAVCGLVFNIAHLLNLVRECDNGISEVMVLST